MKKPRDAAYVLDTATLAPYNRLSATVGHSDMSTRKRSATIPRMNARLVEKQALDLPVEKRARLAQRLLESLDELSEGEAQELWSKEAARRAREIDEGKVRLVSSEELEERMRTRRK